MRITVPTLLLIVSIAVPGLAEEEVIVLNLPDVQRVQGEVSITEPIPFPALH